MIQPGVVPPTAVGQSGRIYDCHSIGGGFEVPAAFRQQLLHKFVVAYDSCGNGFELAEGSPVVIGARGDVGVRPAGRGACGLVENRFLRVPEETMSHSHRPPWVDAHTEPTANPSDVDNQACETMSTRRLGLINAEQRISWCDWMWHRCLISSTLAALWLRCL